MRSATWQVYNAVNVPVLEGGKLPFIRQIKMSSEMTGNKITTLLRIISVQSKIHAPEFRRGIRVLYKQKIKRIKPYASIAFPVQYFNYQGCVQKVQSNPKLESHARFYNSSLSRMQYNHQNTACWEQTILLRVARAIKNTRWFKNACSLVKKSHISYLRPQPTCSNLLSSIPFAHITIQLVIQPRKQQI